MQTINHHCRQCGAKTEQRTPEGDNRLRDVCTQCGAIHYDNPRMVTGTLPIYNEHVLLCKRAIEPRLGYWTLPAGFMENGETLEQGAQRETQEETRAHVDINRLFSIGSVAHIHQVHLFFLATLKDTNFGPTSESLEVKLFAKEDIPWQALAFPTVSHTLRLWCEQPNLTETHVFDVAPMRSMR